MRNKKSLGWFGSMLLSGLLLANGLGVSVLAGNPAFSALKREEQSSTAVLEEIAEEIPEVWLEEVAEEIPEEWMEVIEEEIPEEWPEEAAEEISEEWQEEAAEEISEEWPEEAVEEISEEKPEEAAEEISEEWPEEAAEEISEEWPIEIDEEFVEEQADWILEEPPMLQEGSSGEIYAERVDGAMIQARDQMIVVCPSSGSALSMTPSGENKLGSTEVTIQETTEKAVLTACAQDTAIFDVEDAGEGNIYLRCEAGYLTSTETGNGLFFAAEPVNCSRWQIQEGRFLYNPAAVYTTAAGKTYQNYYVEYFRSAYTMYGKNSKSDLNAFTLEFYRLGEKPQEEEPSDETVYYLPVFETSDVHGYLAETSGKEPLYVLAYVSDKVQDARNRGGEYRADTTILLDGGDIYQGNLLSNRLSGYPMAAAFQTMGYDAVTIGNHEFDWGITTTVDADATMMDYAFGDYTGENTVPVLNMNLYQNGEKVPFSYDYLILEKTAVSEQGEELPVRIGVIGFAGDYASSIMYERFTGEGFSIVPDFQLVNELAQALEENGACDATILLIHEEAALAAVGLGEGSPIDLVLGGHTHQNDNGLTDWGLRYLEPAGNGGAYAYTELAFGQEDEVPVFYKTVNAKTCSISENASLLVNTPDNADELDPALVALSDAAIDALADILSTKIGYITESALRYTYLPESGNRATTYGNWITSVYNRIAGADVSFVNNGGLRTDVLIPEGEDRRDIMLSDLYTMFPFDNEICCFDMTYEDFLQVLVYSLTDTGKTLLSQMTGVICYYTDQTVNAILTADGEEIYVNGEWREGWKDQTLTLAVNSYIVSTNRISADGMSNPLFFGNEEPWEYRSAGIDSEGAISVLTEEGFWNDGYLAIDTNPHYINKTYEESQEPGDEPGSEPGDEPDEPTGTPEHTSPNTGARPEYLWIVMLAAGSLAAWMLACMRQNKF